MVIRFAGYVVSLRREVIASLVFLVFCLIIFEQVRTILPTVMQDELVYRDNTRDFREGNFTFPNYFYFWTYSWVDLFGTAFYEAVKILNLGFHWLTSLLLLFWRPSSLSFGVRFSGSLLFLCSPFLIMTSFEMPEAMYSFLVLSSIILLLEGLTRTSLTYPLVAFAGLLIALAQLTKPHAVFVILGVIIFLTMFSRLEGRRFFGLGLAALYLVSFAISRLLVGFILAGNKGFDFFGNYAAPTNFEEGVGAPGLPSASEALDFAVSLILNLGQHLLVVATFLAPLIYLFLTHRPKLSKEMLLLLVVLFTTIFFISAFESFITVFEADDHLARVLLRHYEFFFPVLWMFGLHEYRKLDFSIRVSGIGIALIQFFFVVLYFSFTLAQGTLWSSSQAADSGFTNGMSTPGTQWISVAIFLSLVLILTRKSKVSYPYFAGLLILSFLFPSISGLRIVMEENSIRTYADDAASYVVSNYPNLNGNEIVVLGTDRPLTQAAVFQINKQDVEYFIYPSGTLVDLAVPPENVRIVVQFGGVLLSQGFQVRTLVQPGFVISEFPE